MFDEIMPRLYVDCKRKTRASIPECIVPRCCQRSFVFPWRSKMAATNGLYSLETKRQAVAYFKENQVPEHVEKLLNKMFKEQPDDIFGYMSEFFGGSSKIPLISKITCDEVLSSRGHPTVQIDLYCTVKGVSKFVTSITIPFDVAPISSRTQDLKPKSPESTKQSVKTTAESQPSAAPSETEFQVNKIDVDDLIEQITETLAPQLKDLDPADQKGIDEILYGLIEEKKTVSRPLSVQENQEDLDQSSEKPDESIKTTRKSVGAIGKKQSGMIDKKGGTKDSGMQLIPDMEEDPVTIDFAVLGVSIATVVAAATLKSCSVFEHLVHVKLSPKQEDDGYIMPIPVMTLLASGKNASGKQNLIKEVLVVPKPGLNTNKGIQQLTEIFHQMGTILSQKFGTSARCITQDGSYSPVLDKPDTALDLVQDAVNGCGYTLGTDVDIILNCAASEFYDQDKQKYEIILNTFKSLDDVINMYSEFLDRYQGIIGIIDGVRSQDKEGWLKLNERIGEKCFIIGDELYKRNPSLLGIGVTEKLSSAGVLNIDQANTVTELTNKASTLTEQGGLLMLSEGKVRDTQTLLVDLAVVVGVRFIKLGGPVHLEHICKYRRLQKIEQELERTSSLTQQQPHVFPVINEVEKEDENAEEQPETKS